MKITPQLKKFIDNHSKLIDENKFEELYSLPDILNTEGLKAQFTQLLFEAKIPFLEHMKRLVSNMFSGTAVDITTLPSNVESIGLQAFKNADNLQKFVIPETVKTIAAGAFDGCANLTSIDIKAPIDGLYVSCFRDCVKLSEVILPNTIKRLGASVFRNCTSLKKITLPKSLEYISTNVFDGSGIETIIYEGSEDDFNKISGSDYITRLPISIIFQE